MNTFRNAMVLVIMMMISTIVQAQWNADLSVTNMYDDNVNNNAEQWESNISVLGAAFGYTAEGTDSELDLSYDGSFSYYNSFISRTNQYHSGNISYTRLMGDDGQDRFRLTGTYGLGVNRDAFTVFDHSYQSAATEYKYFITERIINTLGYAFRSVTFPQLNDFSYSEHALMVKGAFAFTQTTTGIVQTDLGTKFYSTAVSGSGSSMRKGIMSSILPSVTQIAGMAKLGQGITPAIGMSLTARYQWNLQKQTRYLSSEYGFISDDELFDDHYGYEGLHTSLQYTHIFSETVKGKLTGGIQNKLYSTLSAYDWEGNIVADQRTDRRSYVNLLIEKNFIDAGFSLKGSLDLIDNTSNDAYYDYRNTAVSLELGIPF